jgi:hypothetical protein
MHIAIIERSLSNTAQHLCRRNEDMLGGARTHSGDSDARQYG